MSRIRRAAVCLISIALCFLFAQPSQAQVAVSLTPIPRVQFLGSNGSPLSGGCVFTYSAGTSTPQATYVDSTGTIQNPNPVILDAGGRASIWITNQAYKFVLFSSGGVNCASGQQQWMVDNITNSIAQLLSTTNTWSGQNTFNGALIESTTNAGNVAAKYFSGDNVQYVSPSGADSNDGLSPGTAKLTPQTAINTATTNGTKTGVVYFACGTYTGPLTLYSQLSLISLCPTAATPVNQVGTGLAAATVLTYSSQLTLTSLTNLHLVGFTLAFADSGFGITLSNDFNFNWAYVNLHECGNTTTPCLLITTNGTSSTNNSAANYFDHMIIKANTAALQNAIAIQLLGQGAVGTGAIATDNTFVDTILGGNLRMGVDCELNSDSNVFRGMQVFQVLVTPVANTAMIVLNNNTPASDQDADNEHFYDVFYTGAAWHGVRAGQIYGGDFSLGSSASDVVVAGGAPSYTLKISGLVGATSSLLTPNMSATRFFGNGTPMTTGKFAFNAGWGTSPSFTSAHGTDMAWSLQLTSGGGSPSANPTITLTFNDGSFSFPVICSLTKADANAPTTYYWAAPLPGSTGSYTFTFVGTPTASTAYALTATCLGSPN